MSGRARSACCWLISAARAWRLSGCLASRGAAGRRRRRRGGAAALWRRTGREADVRAELVASRKFGVDWLAPGEAGYPSRLATSDDAPPLLGVRGAPETLMRPGVPVAAP